MCSAITLFSLISIGVGILRGLRFGTCATQAVRCCCDSVFLIVVLQLFLLSVLVKMTLIGGEGGGRFSFSFATYAYSLVTRLH